MTVGEIIDILEQFPRDQIMEMGIVTKITKEDPPIIVDPDIHSVLSLCACKCANLPLSERVPGVTQAIVAP